MNEESHLERAELDRIGTDIVDVAFQIHKTLGPGLREEAYEKIFAKHLRARGHAVQTQKPITTRIEEILFRNAFRVDVVVANSVIVEIKAEKRFSPVWGRQTLTYMKLMNVRLGYVINFGQPTLKAGIQRLANNLQEIPQRNAAEETPPQRP